MPERPGEELKAAVDSMFRIRAVESPPDVRGIRTIWHRGIRGAELVTEVDPRGRVVRQDFTLFDDVLRWEPGSAGVIAYTVAPSTSAGAPGQPALRPSAPQQPLERAELALRGYEGKDRYLIHLRERVRSALGPDGTEPDTFVTGDVVTGPRPRLNPTAARPWRSAAILAVAILAALAVAGFAALRGGW